MEVTIQEIRDDNTFIVGNIQRVEADGDGVVVYPESGRDSRRYVGTIAAVEQANE